MKKDILLYGSIWQYSAMYFFDQIKEVLAEDPEAEITIRINCTGGEPDYGWGIINKIQEMGNVKIVVDSMAHSMALFLLAYVPVENITVTDVSRGVLHRAAYPEYVESNENWFTEPMRTLLSQTNKSLEKAFRARVDVEVLENLPQFKTRNMTLKDIFSMEGREEVILTASDMKKIGLVKSITKITPQMQAQFDVMLDRFQKVGATEQFKIAAEVKPKITKTENMNLEKLKAEHPELYAQIVAMATSAEKDRCEAWYAFNDADPAAVKAGIESGASMTQKQMVDLTIKMSAKNTVAAVTAEAPKAEDTATESAPAVAAAAAGEAAKVVAKQVETDKKKSVTASFEAELDERLGLKTKQA